MALYQTTSKRHSAGLKFHTVLSFQRSSSPFFYLYLNSRRLLCVSIYLELFLTLFLSCGTCCYCCCAAELFVYYGLNFMRLTWSKEKGWTLFYFFEMCCGNVPYSTFSGSCFNCVGVWDLVFVARGMKIG